MKIGKVVGTVTATRKDPSHEARKILLVEPVDPDGRPAGERVLALDIVDAGVGDRVLIVQEGWSAATAVDREGSAIDTAVVGVVDQVQMA
jgi:ethanolamine utilization protein EutN